MCQIRSRISTLDERRTKKEERRTEMVIKLIARERATIAKLALSKTLQVICRDIVYEANASLLVEKSLVCLSAGYLRVYDSSTNARRVSPSRVSRKFAIENTEKRSRIHDNSRAQIHGYIIKRHRNYKRYTYAYMFRVFPVSFAFTPYVSLTYP